LNEEVRKLKHKGNCLLGDIKATVLERRGQKIETQRKLS